MNEEPDRLGVFEVTYIISTPDHWVYKRAIECPSCSGKGYVKQTLLKTTLKTKTQICITCGGSGKIYGEGN